jgi:hypothetical protein
MVVSSFPSGAKTRIPHFPSLATKTRPFLSIATPPWVGPSGLSSGSFAQPATDS